MKIVVIYTSFRTSEYLNASLDPWLNAVTSNLCGHHWSIAAVSVPFEGFGIQEDSWTKEYLEAHHRRGLIDWLLADGKPRTETEARGVALRWAREQGADLVWQADGDEAPTLEQIERIITYVQSQSLVWWFKLSLRNAVFDEHTYLVEPFTPPRIHRLSINGYTAEGFYQDNNVYYRGAEGVKRDTDLACLTIPSTIAAIKHYSWIDNHRSRLKTEYQLARWQTCSFKWNYETNHLEWNENPPPATESG